ncbi:DNA cytosine methyltransferase [Actinomadura sp. DC4]|uniref:DNA cytosine methyltransferase n=1 Tax=Actinomadura sp. DC4 TaxID=3055069 RepID=UPI0025B1E656|nr:DNA cytosine methyltransferase [Actinomadura sp. DC4]MDN3359275.1 DNA cytosine methyltransferase [Actinomadura sp. DC4]
MCTGYGGLDLAAQALYGGQLIWCAENDPYATVLLHRRFPGVPNVGDLTAVDWTQVPAVDIVTAGFPCQDISYAGPGAGIKRGTRSGLWLTIAEALRLLRPGLVLVENVAALRTRGLPTVLGDLAALGYHTAWMCLRAADVGAPHRRDRMFIAAAHPASPRIPRQHLPSQTKTARTPGQSVRCGMCRAAADADGLQCQRRRNGGVLAGAPGTATAKPRHAAQCCRTALAHPTGNRWDQGQPEPARLQRRPHPAVCGNQPAAPAAAVTWGAYAPAIHGWETILGRPAPQPTETGTRGQPRLSARFVEWMMGLSAGWVTDLPLTRAAQMRLLGNGVVPQQAIAAFRALDGGRPTDTRDSAGGGS